MSTGQDTSTGQDDRPESRRQAARSLAGGGLPDPGQVTTQAVAPSTGRVARPQHLEVRAATTATGPLPDPGQDSTGRS